MLNNNTGPRVFAGFLIGLAAGTILSFLLAPQSGDETRDKIRDISGRLVDDTRDGIKKVNSSVVSFFDNIVNTIKNKFDGKGAVV